jgi:hypothetical protein
MRSGDSEVLLKRKRNTPPVTEDRAFCPEKVPGTLFANEPVAAVLVSEVREVPGTFSSRRRCSLLTTARPKRVDVYSRNRSSRPISTRQAATSPTHATLDTQYSICLTFHPSRFTHHVSPITPQYWSFGQKISVAQLSDALSWM